MELTILSGSACRSYEGLTSCGDAVLIASQGPVQLFALVDALGHGPDAARSADRAVAVLKQNPALPLQELFLACDQALVGMRGIVLSAVQVRSGAVSFSGVGNVELYGPPEVRRPPSVSGTLGRGFKVFREYPLEGVMGQRWVLVSDGLRARDMSKAMVAVSGLEAGAAAQELLKLAARPDDDASVLVMDFQGHG